MHSRESQGKMIEDISPLGSIKVPDMKFEEGIGGGGAQFHFTEIRLWSEEPIGGKTL